MDKESKLEWYYFGARYYDPAIARFLSVDPHASSYPSWTPYNYCFNNPLVFIDPDGKDAVEEKTETTTETTVYESGYTKTTSTTTVTVTYPTDEYGRTEQTSSTSSSETWTNAEGETISSTVTNPDGTTTNLGENQNNGAVLDPGEVQSVTVQKDVSAKFLSGSTFVHKEGFKLERNESGGFERKALPGVNKMIPKNELNKRKKGFISNLKKIINPVDRKKIKSPASITSQRD